jgi:flagellar protein FliO/FliZ
LLVVCTLCIFNLSVTPLFAQEEPSGEGIAVQETPAVDPIIAREQALSLGDNGTGAAASPPAASAWGIFRVILTLAVVAAAIYGLVFFIKRTARGGNNQDPFLKILANAPLGANRGVYIIAVGSKVWLVGAAENGVSLISEIEDKDVLNAMLLEDSRKSAEAPAGRFPDFKSLLQRLGMPMEPGAPPGPEDIRKRRERLKGL